MTFTTLQNQLVPKINQALQAFLDSLDFGQSTNLKHMIAYHLGWRDADNKRGGTGKRIRPLLTLLCTGSFDSDLVSAMPVATGIEFLHNFTLIHDDIEDRSPFRHGRATLWKKWGIPQAINAGDALFSIAHLVLLDIAGNCGNLIAVQAARQFNQVCLHLTQGQYLDIAFEERDEVALDSYIEMITGKTAALIAYATKMGGLIAGVDKHKQQLLTKFGESLGMAFQVQDDYLGIWGNPKITGKSAASDLLTRKKTLPVLFGLRDCPEFRSLWEKPRHNTEQVNRMSQLLEDCGSRTYTQEQSTRYTNQAFSSLGALFPINNEFTHALNELCEILLNRKL